jgi:hypothetical protein
MTDFTIGSMVRFSWWSSYKAPSDVLNASGHSIWYEIFPGDIGIVITDDRTATEDQLVVLFARTNLLLKIHASMLIVIECQLTV